ncbi:uncharacterized protein LOC126980302 [Eriocheir sinensis]|uniref:uncharacterized protein LOC126980302 n=1 Tax=Eriocheir sinensis TaxID=95602 RepID=UPI0021C85888|nr:uncharacterized protein LOC126980302 [Eriocheir sinensis]
MSHVGNVNTTTVKFFVVCMAVSLVCLHMELTHFRSNTPHATPREHHEFYWSSSGYRRTKVRSPLKKVENGEKTLDNSYDASGSMNEVYDSANEEVILNAFRSVTYRKLRSNWSARFNSGVQRRVSASNNFETLPENDSSLMQTRLQRSKSIILKHNNAYDQLIHLLTTFTIRGISSDFLPPSRPSTPFPSLKCSYVLPYSSSSSICKKSKRHCVKISAASETGQQLPVTHVNTLSHTRVQDVYLSGYENPLSRGCRVVERKEGRRLGNDKSVLQVKAGNECLKDIDYPNTCKESRKIRVPEEEEEAEEEEDGKSYTPIPLTIDSQRSFVHELGALTKFPHCLALDLLFDLAGLNSLHRHEVISTLLQELRKLLFDRQYRLVRSSTDGGDLQQFLHQEGLQQPLLVHALWQRLDCD